MKQQEERDYKIISNAINIIAATCAGDKDKIIDLLTGYLWDEEEAAQIKTVKE